MFLSKAAPGKVLRLLQRIAQLQPMQSQRREADAALVAAVAAGDEDAFARAYDEYGRMVFGLAQRIVGNAAEAEEVMQEVFLSLWKRAAQFDPERGSLMGYLLTLTRTASIDRLRYHRARPAAPTEDDAGGLAIEHAPPIDFATSEDARTRIASALSTLPAEERRVLELAYFEGLSQTEIATKTGWPLGTVKGRTRNGLRRLRESLPTSLGGEAAA